MLIDEFLEPRILIVSGKGGVGKTTVAAALAIVAARHGHKVCLAEVDRKGALPKLFGSGPVGYTPQELAPDIWALNIAPQEALAEYLRVQYHMRRISWVFTSTHFLDFVATGAPGLKDILILGKIWYLEQGRTAAHHFDTIIVDAPAAGHMLTFLSAPKGLSDAVRVGPVRRQAQWLNDMLQDPKRARIHLVTLAEEMPITETLETTKALSGKLQIAQGPLFANGIYSELLAPDEMKAFEAMESPGDRSGLIDAATEVSLRLDGEDLDALVGYARFLNARRSLQTKYLKMLRKEASDPVVELPFLFSAGLALPDIETLADVMEERVEKL